VRTAFRERNDVVEVDALGGHAPFGAGPVSLSLGVRPAEQCAANNRIPLGLAKRAQDAI